MDKERITPLLSQLSFLLRESSHWQRLHLRLTQRAPAAAAALQCLSCQRQTVFDPPAMILSFGSIEVLLDATSIQSTLASASGGDESHPGAAIFFC